MGQHGICRAGKATGPGERMGRGRWQLRSAGGHGRIRQFAGSPRWWRGVRAQAGTRSA